MGLEQSNGIKESWICIELFCWQVIHTKRAQGGMLSVKDCVELERSNLFGYAANNNERLLKVATEELQLRTKIDGKNK